MWIPVPILFSLIYSYWLRFLEQAFDAAIEFGEWGKAIEWGARIIPAYKLVSERPQRL